MIFRCLSVPGPCDRCGRQAFANLELCDTCLVGGRPARPVPDGLSQARGQALAEVQAERRAA